MNDWWSLRPRSRSKSLGWSEHQAQSLSNHNDTLLIKRTRHRRPDDSVRATNGHGSLPLWSSGRASVSEAYRQTYSPNTSALRHCSAKGTVAVFCDDGDPFISDKDVDYDKGLCRPLRRKGTGPHDDVLAQSHGQYRHPSLRRDGGLSVKTPRNMRKHINGNQGVVNPTLPQQAVTPPASSPNSSQGVGDRTRDQGRQLRSAAVNASQVGSNASPTREDSRVASSRSETTMVQLPQPVPALVSGHIASEGVINNDDRLRIFIECLKRKADYHDLPDRMNCPEQPFWEKVLAGLEERYKTKVRNSWKELKNKVFGWSETRRRHLRVGDLTVPGDGREALDTAIDEWNRVFCRRLCKVNRGFIDVGIWEACEQRVLSFIGAELQEWVNNLLDRRIAELDRSLRPPLLTESSTVEDYSMAVKNLATGFRADGRNSVAVRETEALMSWVLELKPDLEKTLREQMKAKMSRNAWDDEINEEETTRDDLSEARSDDDILDGGWVGSIERVMTPEPSPHMLHRLYEYEDELRRDMKAMKAIKEAHYGGADSTGLDSSPKRRLEDEKSGVRHMGESPKRPRLSRDLDSSVSDCSTFSFPSVNSLLRGTQRVSSGRNDGSSGNGQARDRGSTRDVGTMSSASGVGFTPASPSPADRASKPVGTESPLFLRDSMPAPGTRSCPRKPSVRDMSTLSNTPTPRSRGLSEQRRCASTGGNSQQRGFTNAGRFGRNMGSRSGLECRETSRHGRSQSRIEHQDGPPRSASSSTRKRWVHGALSKNRRHMSRCGQMKDTSPGRFRESTVEFQALTPKSRDQMLYEAVRAVRRKTSHPKQSDGA